MVQLYKHSIQHTPTECSPMNTTKPKPSVLQFRKSQSPKIIKPWQQVITQWIKKSKQMKYHRAVLFHEQRNLRSRQILFACLSFSSHKDLLCRGLFYLFLIKNINVVNWICYKNKQKHGLAKWENAGMSKNKMWKKKDLTCVIVSSAVFL